jgi:putative membrane protein
MKLYVTTFCAALCMAAGAQTASEKDMKFAREAAEGSMMEIKLGELAQTNGSTAEVKSLGTMMITDHTKANDELKALAAQKNISLPGTMSDKAQKHYDKLAKKQGKDFDKAYAKCMVHDHKKDICLFKKEAKKGDDADLKQWASNTVPTLEHHKQMSEETCKAVHKNK